MMDSIREETQENKLLEQICRALMTDREFKKVLHIHL